MSSNGGSSELSLLSNGSREGGGRNGRKIFVWSGGKPRRKRWIGMMDGKKGLRRGKGRRRKGWEQRATRLGSLCSQTGLDSKVSTVRYGISELLRSSRNQYKPKRKASDISLMINHDASLFCALLLSFFSSPARTCFFESNQI